MVDKSTDPRGVMTRFFTGIARTSSRGSLRHASGTMLSYPDSNLRLYWNQVPGADQYQLQMEPVLVRSALDVQLAEGRPGQLHGGAQRQRDDVAVAARNGPTHTVVSGPAAPVDATAAAISAG